MKFALLITQNCNLACHYCYIKKSKSTMELSLAEKAVNFIFDHSAGGEDISIGFFGGEPLLEFELLKSVTHIIEKHPMFGERNVEIQVTTNGTLFTDEIIGFLAQHNIGLGISCDGFPSVQDASRRFTDGKPSSKIVEENLKKAVDCVPGIMINAVFTPLTYKFLPESVEYFYSLGIRRIFINPDFSSKWQFKDYDGICDAYNNISKKFVQWHINNDPAFISIINGKILVILNDGYNLNERCQMGKKEFAITPNGNIYPCERLVGEGSINEHCIGNISDGVDYRRFCLSKNFSKPAISVCDTCTLKKYCMNWCGCSNYFSTGHYDQAGTIICVSEKASINAAFSSFTNLESMYGVSIIEKLAGESCNRETLPVMQGR